MNYSSEFFECRGRKIVRGITNHASNTGINPLTKVHKRGREKLKMRLINQRLRISLKGVEGAFDSLRWRLGIADEVMNLPKGSRRGFLGKPMAKAVILVMPYLMTYFNAVSELNIFPAGFAAGYSLVGACSGLSTYDE